MRVIGRRASRVLRAYYRGPDHPMKLRLWWGLYKRLHHPRLTIPYARGGWITVDLRDLLQREIFAAGAYESEVWESLAACAVADEIVWDVGAHIGSFSIRALLDQRVKEVHAFEPDPIQADVLAMNLAFNDHRHTIHRCALGSHSGTVKLYRGPLANTGLSSLKNPVSAEIVEVPSKTVDELVFKEHLPPPTLMKVDVEDWESHVFEGSQQLLAASPPKAIAFETTCDSSGRIVDGSLLEFLKARGYQISRIQRPSGSMENRENYVARRAVAIGASSGSRRHHRPTLGVLVTYFNEGEIVRRTLDSLLVQSEGPEEILIYDDASADPPQRVLPQNFPGRVIRGEKNRGPAYGRNRLLEMSRCDYVHFHDADDLFHPQWCQRVRQTIAQTGADVVLTEISSYERDKLLCERLLGLQRLKWSEDFVRFCIRNPLLTSAGTYRREVVAAMGGYRESLWQSEDYDFHIRLASQGVSYAVVTDPLIFRSRPAGRSQNHMEVWSSATEAVERLSWELPRRYQQDLATAALQAGSALFRVGARRQAREAFRLAQKIGPPSFDRRGLPYAWTARVLGPEMAETIGIFYRKIIPQRIRGTRARSGRD